MAKIHCVKNNTWLWVLRLALLCASIATMIFIFSNSLKSAEESSRQSSNALQVVQKIAMVIAPDSQIANATGPWYDFLHTAIRSMAHFLEFALLGALCSFTIFTYTFSKAWQSGAILSTVAVAVVDECLQLTAISRAFEFADILLDGCGGMVGVAFAVLCVWIGVCVSHKRKVKKEKACDAVASFADKAIKE